MQGHERGELRIGRDARAVLAAHDEARTRDVLPEGAGLYSLRQWACNFPSTYEFQYATIVPPAWPRAVALTLDEYKGKFDSRWSEVAEILRETENVCVCGGAALSPFCDVADDVDVFLFGLDEPQMWLKAQELADKIRAAYPRAREISQELAPGVITLRVHEGTTRTSIQIIMRVYESMARVAHSFDIAICGVAFDGDDVYMTRMAAFELLHRVIVVVPAYRSPSFGHRLAKYHKRGLALAMLDASFARVPVKKGEEFTVGDLRVEPFCVCGRLLVASVNALDTDAPSDYEPSHEPMRFGASRWRNLHQLTSREFRFIVRGSLAGRAPPLALAAFSDAPPTLRDVLSKRDLCEALRDSARASVARCGKVNVRVLRRVFRLSDAELSAFAVAASRAMCTARRVDASEALRRFSTPILELYDALPQRIEWVCARGVTSSRTPAPKTAEEWYGDRFATTNSSRRPPSKDETIAMLHARMIASDENRALDGTCALCFGAVHSKGLNTVTLRCRHTFHFSQAESGCMGLSAWTRGDCPLCRQAFTPTKPSESEESTPSVQLAVEWPEGPSF